jgi:hypothetical protein
MPQSHSGFDSYCARYPPSTGSTAPVMNEASSEARKAMALATSAGSPMRPIGCMPSIAARYSEPPGSSGGDF